MYRCAYCGFPLDDPDYHDVDGYCLDGWGHDETKSVTDAILGEPVKFKRASTTPSEFVLPPADDLEDEGYGLDDEYGWEDEDVAYDDPPWHQRSIFERLAHNARTGERKQISSTLTYSEWPLVKALYTQG